MSKTGRNFVVAYVLLVGLPLLGLAGVLKAGRNLAAPISIDGAWKLQTDPVVSAQPACAAELAGLTSQPLIISQSGKSFVLTFTAGAKPSASGTIDGSNLSASFASVGDASTCGFPTRIAFSAIVDKSAPKSLTGTLLAENCSSCTPIRFHAVRQPKPSTGSTH